MSKKYYTTTEARKKIEHYCAYQERCHQEVIDKLRELGLAREQIDQMLGHLIENDYLNETRFAQSYARGKFRIKKWGKIKITRELKRRNISDYNLKKGLAEIGDSEYMETLSALAEKLWSSHKSNPIKLQKDKVIRALYSRGWENHLVLDKIMAMEKRMIS